MNDEGLADAKAATPFVYPDFTQESGTVTTQGRAAGPAVNSACPAELRPDWSLGLMLYGHVHFSAPARISSRAVGIRARCAKAGASGSVASSLPASSRRTRSAKWERSATESHGLPLRAR